MSSSKIPMTRIAAKERARALQAEARSAGKPLAYTQALAQVAREAGYANVHEMTAQYITADKLLSPIPAGDVEFLLDNANFLPRGFVSVVTACPGSGVISRVLDKFGEQAVFIDLSILDNENDERLLDAVNEREIVVVSGTGNMDNCTRHNLALLVEAASRAPFALILLVHDHPDVRTIVDFLPALRTIPFPVFYPATDRNMTAAIHEKLFPETDTLRSFLASVADSGCASIVKSPSGTGFIDFCHRILTGDVVHIDLNKNSRRAGASSLQGPAADHCQLVILTGFEPTDRETKVALKSLADQRRNQRSGPGLVLLVHSETALAAAQAEGLFQNAISFDLPGPDDGSSDALLQDLDNWGGLGAEIMRYLHEYPTRCIGAAGAGVFDSKAMTPKEWGYASHWVSKPGALKQLVDYGVLPEAGVAAFVDWLSEQRQ